MNRALLPLLALALTGAVVALWVSGRGVPESSIGRGDEPSARAIVPGEEHDAELLRAEDRTEAPRAPERRADAAAPRAGNQGRRAATPGKLAVEFRVRDELGRPVREVGFHIWRTLEREDREHAQRFERSLSDEDGAYRLAVFSPGRWSVVAVPHEEGWPKGVTSQTVEVTVPHEGPPVELELPRPGSVRGIVLDADEQPIAGATVAAHAAGKRVRETANEQGEFHLPAVPAGEIVLVAEHGGLELSHEIRVEPATELAGVVLRFRRGGFVSGIVLDPQDMPMPDCDVALLTDSDDVEGAETGDDGRFLIGPLEPGNYTIVASESLGDDMSEGLMTQPLEVREGETTEVVLQRASGSDTIELFGRVTLAGEPLPDLDLLVFREGGGLIDTVRTAQTDEEGRYRVRLDAPGAVLFVTETRGQMITISHVSVPAGSSFQHDIEFPAGCIRGSIVGGGNDEWTVILAREDGFLELALPDTRPGFRARDGKFEFRGLRVGQYVLHARSSSGRVAAPIHDLHLSAGEELNGIELRATDGSSLSGTVTRAGGVAVAGARISVRDERGTEVATGETRENGGYAIPGVPAGKVIVLAQADALAGRGETQVVEGEVELDLVLEAGGVLEVQVRDASGQPLSASIRVFASGGDDVTSPAAGGGVTGFTSVLSFSETRVGPLPTGTYRVVATAGDGRRAERDAVVGTQLVTLVIEL